ncbi:hypothetical protein QEN19_003719 [Hanseniaspora menglaensis]
MSPPEAYSILSYWHATKPIYSCQFSPLNSANNRFVTCGGDNKIKIWRFKNEQTEDFEKTIDKEKLNVLNSSLSLEDKLAYSTLENESNKKSAGNLKQTSNNISLDASFSIKTHFQKAKDRVNNVEYISTLKGFSKPVNVAKYSKCGKYIAACGDDGYILVWEKVPVDLLEKLKKESAHSSQMLQMGHLASEIEKLLNPNKFPISYMGDYEDDEDEDMADISAVKELYRVIRYFPVTSLSVSDHVEIYSLDWSADSRHLVVGYMNTYIKIIDINNAQQPYIVVKKQHNDVVQGCCWDPRNELVVSMGADRAMCVFKLKFSLQNRLMDLKLVNRIVKGEMDLSGKQENIFAQVDLNFFRKLQFSPDGNLLVLPYGIWKNDANDEVNCVHIFHRANLIRGLNKPVATIPNLKKKCLCVSFNPNFYYRNNLSSSGGNLFALDHKMIFAVATEDEIMIYDTDNMKCLMTVKNLHYYTIYDLSWNAKGDKIIICSKDGFLSTIDLGSYSFGEIIAKTEIKEDLINVETPIIELQSASSAVVNVLSVRKK